MSDYGEGALALIEAMGLNPTAVIGELMRKLKADAELSERNIAALSACLDSQSATIFKLKEEHKEHLELIDEVAAHNTIRVLCRSCDNSYVMDYELSLYDPQHSYCGGSDRCCP